MRCLLATALDTPRRDLRRVMSHLGVELVEVDQLGEDWLTQEPIPAIDFVCGVLRLGLSSEAESAIYVEIGVALGRHIPVFLIVEPPFQVPLILTGLTRVEAVVENTAAVELHLAQFIRRIGRSIDPKSSGATRPALTPSQVNHTLAQLAALHAHGRNHPGSRFEQLIHDLFVSSGAEVSTLRGASDIGHDLAIWTDQAGPIFGGPVLIELKLVTFATRSQLREAVIRFIGQLSRHASAFGMLIYSSPDSSDGQFEPAFDAPVAVISARELVGMLGQEPLARVLISMRNAAVHRGYRRARN